MELHRPSFVGSLHSEPSFESRLTLEKHRSNYKMPVVAGGCGCPSSCKSFAVSSMESKFAFQSLVISAPDADAAAVQSSLNFGGKAVYEILHHLKACQKVVNGRFLASGVQPNHLWSIIRQDKHCITLLRCRYVRTIWDKQVPVT